MKQALIFDLDGTLWDSADPIADSWNLVCHRHADARDVLITREQLLGLMGQTMDRFTVLMPETMPKARAQALIEECMDYENAYLQERGGTLLGDVKTVFEDLHKKDIGVYIVSNCQAGYIEAFLMHYHLEHLVDDLECYGNTGQGKAENLKLLIQRNQLDAYYYLGDTQGDYEACCQAEVPFVWASYGFGTVDAPVKRIKALEEIVNIM